MSTRFRARRFNPTWEQSSTRFYRVFIKAGGDEKDFVDMDRWESAVATPADGNLLSARATRTPPAVDFLLEGVQNGRHHAGHRLFGSAAELRQVDQAVGCAMANGLGTGR